MAKAFVDNVRPVKPDKNYLLVKPLEDFAENELPESVLFFVNADQLSALTFLSHFDAPESTDRVLAPFASACMSLVTLPLKLARNNEQKAVIGLFDLAARTRMPQELLSFALPYAFLKKMAEAASDSFLTTENWKTIKERI